MTHDVVARARSFTAHRKVTLVVASLALVTVASCGNSGSGTSPGVTAERFFSAVLAKDQATALKYGTEEVYESLVQQLAEEPKTREAKLLECNGPVGGFYDCIFASEDPVFGVALSIEKTSDGRFQVFTKL